MIFLWQDSILISFPVKAGKCVREVSNTNNKDTSEHKTSSDHLFGTNMIQTSSTRHQARNGFTMFIVHHSYPQFFQVTKDTSIEISSNFKAFKFYKFNLLSKYTHGETANLSRFIHKLNMLKRASLSFPIFTHHFLD